MTKSFFKMQKHFIGLKASWKESPFRVYTACRRERSPLPLVAEALRMMDSRLSLVIRHKIAYEHDLRGPELGALVFRLGKF
ncbi:MAG: hypothetical protein IKR48_05520, partial [Kiritimatiellae bacterium]|nr:hypothetical protein [Kiritimatiellia bacterium]